MSRAKQNAAGYQRAFYEVAAMLGIPAQSISPKEAWETQIRPALQAAIAHIDTSDNSILMQALHDPENQPSQFGTVPVEYLERANELIEGLVRSFSYRGCDCMVNSNDCCTYAVAWAYLGHPLCPVVKAVGDKK